LINVRSPDFHRFFILDLHIGGVRRALVLAALVLTGVGVRLATRPPAPQSIVVPVADKDATPSARGRTVYTRYGCSACHGVDGKGGFPNPNAETAAKVPGVNFVAESYTRSELRQEILRGVATIGKADPNGPRPPYRMPGWTGQMSDQEAGDLVEYLFSIYPKSEAQKWR
jgi:mono/diheme cytochrome c family protein